MMTRCQECGKEMTVHGDHAITDTFICGDCHEMISKPVHPALAGDPQALKAAMQTKLPTMEARDGLWGSSGCFLHTMHLTQRGVLPGMELIEGVSAEDASAKLMNRVRACVADPNCVRIVYGPILMEMRRLDAGEDQSVNAPPGGLGIPHNRLNGHG